jgi:hypothetical protein
MSDSDSDSDRGATGVAQLPARATLNLEKGVS